jgi:hypothetical protein
MSWFCAPARGHNSLYPEMMDTCDSANADPLPRIAGYVRPKRVSDDVDLAACHVMILLQSISM